MSNQSNPLTRAGSDASATSDGAPSSRRRLNFKYSDLSNIFGAPTVVTSINDGNESSTEIESFDCNCDTCLQGTDEFEKDLLPEKEEKLKWFRFNKCKSVKKNLKKSKKTKKRSGKECYPCYAVRRKFHKK